MLELSVPASLGLSCASCKGHFTVLAEVVQNTVFCPYCGQLQNLLDAMEPELRRNIYSKVRDYLERRVYDEQQLSNLEYDENTAVK